ncbi:hypothetical protein C8F01DRAFT_590671 [Mycena amicta]|nr:hypothetical protein C8F01DRAFT_590671 [Mycena amicta]
MTTSPGREIGTLIVVILKANHLPNKRHIGKQDPYCLVAVNGEKQRTKVIKRGGQHPEWDEEIRFTIYEDDLDVTATGPNGTPPPPPPKDGKRKIRGGSTMKLSCFADDPREPDLIGQADVDLTEVLTKGETDEWFTLMNKDKFAGKVYLELTFWSNESPPEKTVVPVAPKNNQEYSGPGLFTASEDVPATANFPSSRVVSTGSMYTHSRRQSDTTPPATIHPSHSLSQIDYYQPPYEHQYSQRSRVSSFNALTNELGELSLQDHGRRRESFPPPQSNMYGPIPPSSSFPAYPPQHGYEPSIPDSASVYSYDRPVTPPGQSHGGYIPPYRPPYESGSGAYNPPPARGPRYSMPATSSGFIPLSSSTSSGSIPLASHPSEPSGFAPSLPPTPAPPMNYAPASSYIPAPTQTPAPGYLPASSSFHSQQGLPASQSYPYMQYQAPSQYNPPPAHLQTSAPVHGYPLPPSPTGHQVAPSLSHSNSLSSSAGPGSRPLPQQPVHSQSLPPPPPPPQYGFSPSASQPAIPGSYSPLHPSSSAFHESYSPSHVQSYVATDLEGPYNGSSPRRQNSLPTPNYVPPPPPPPLEYSLHNPPPPPPPLPYYPGPPPRPPVQQDAQLPWLQPPPPPPPQQGWN